MIEKDLTSLLSFQVKERETLNKMRLLDEEERREGEDSDDDDGNDGDGEESNAFKKIQKREAVKDKKRLMELEGEDPKVHSSHKHHALNYWQTDCDKHSSNPNTTATPRLPSERRRRLSQPHSRARVERHWHRRCCKMSWGWTDAWPAARASACGCPLWTCPCVPLASCCWRTKCARCTNTLTRPSHISVTPLSHPSPP